MKSNFKKYTNNGYELYYLSSNKVNVIRLEQTKDKTKWKIVSYPMNKDKIDFSKSVLLAMVYDNKFKILGVEYKLEFSGDEVILISPDNNSGSPADPVLSSDTIPF